MKKFYFDPKKVNIKEKEKIDEEINNNKKVHLEKASMERGQRFGRKFFPYNKGNKK